MVEEMALRLWRMEEETAGLTQGGSLLPLSPGSTLHCQGLAHKRGGQPDNTRHLTSPRGMNTCGAGFSGRPRKEPGPGVSSPIQALLEASTEVALCPLRLQRPLSLSPNEHSTGMLLCPFEN